MLLDINDPFVIRLEEVEYVGEPLPSFRSKLDLEFFISSSLCSLEAVNLWFESEKWEIFERNLKLLNEFERNFDISLTDMSNYFEFKIFTKERFFDRIYFNLRLKIIYLNKKELNFFYEDYIARSDLHLLRIGQ